MGLLSIRKKREHLVPVEEACERSARVRVAFRNAEGRIVSAYTRVLALEEQQIVLQWPGDEFAPIAGGEALVDVFFHLDKSDYAFSSMAKGRATRWLSRLGTLPVLYVAVPDHIETRQQRARFRVSLHSGDPVHAQVCSFEDQKVLFSPRIVNLSAGGILTVIEDPSVKRISIGAEFWITFTLPDDPKPLGFRARLAHRNELRTRAGGFALGWSFTPDEDPDTNAANTERIEKFVALRQRAQLRRAR